MYEKRIDRAASAKSSVCKKAMLLIKRNSSDGYILESRKRGEWTSQEEILLERIAGLRRDRSKDTLLASIKSNIKEGTAMKSDCWKTCDCLDDEGFLHLSVNYKIFFKDPETGANTNSIQVSWSAIKKSIRGTRSVRINLILTLRSSCGES
ncbi:putative isxo2-like transposase domain protein [Trichonephila clavipes]|nr:putative isxo2-like transposase domain protein [Trichonephila clavipes]